MKTTIYISSRLGNDLRTRSFFRRDMEQLLDGTSHDALLDFSNVWFISRSVADEICNLMVDYPSLAITGMDGDVKTMYELVSRGRQHPREYPDLNAKVYHLKTFQEMQEFFEAI